MVNQTLSEEYAYFNEIKKELTNNNYEGKYALIKGHNLVGIYDTDTDAYQVGIMQYGNEPFLIVKISQENEIFWIPTLELGLLDANNQ
jgi:hypothetical protein